MSSTLRIITNGLGSNDQTIIVFDGEIIYEGSSNISSKYMFEFITSFGSADHNHFKEMTDVQFINWDDNI